MNKIKLKNVIYIGVSVAFSPIFIYLFMIGEFEIDVLSGLIVFFIFDSSPLIYCWNKLDKLNSEKSLFFQEEKESMQIAIYVFIISHLLFYGAFVYAISGEDSGKSTAPIVFLFLPFLSIFIFSLSYKIVFLFKKN